MFRYLPRNPTDREFTIAQLLGIAVGAVLMVGFAAYVLITRGFSIHY